MEFGKKIKREFPSTAPVVLEEKLNCGTWVSLIVESLTIQIDRDIDHGYVNGGTCLAVYARQHCVIMATTTTACVYRNPLAYYNKMHLLGKPQATKQPMVKDPALV